MSTKSDIVHDTCNWISYNRGLVLGVICGVVLVAYLIGCEPKTPSIIDPTRMVNAEQLQREIIQVEADYAEKLKLAECAKDDLSAQYEFREKLVSIAGGIGKLTSEGATTGGLVGAGAQILTLVAGAFLFYDNRRKDGIIKSKSKATPPA